MSPAAPARPTGRPERADRTAGDGVEEAPPHGAAGPASTPGLVYSFTPYTKAKRSVKWMAPSG